MMANRDWYAWHSPYDDPSSRLSRRLSWVRDRIRTALDEAPAGPVTLISLCAGQGRDVIGVLADHPRRGDVTDRLVELDPRNTETARQLAAAAGLDVGPGPGRVEIVTGDASLTSQYADLAAADVVVAAGIFGNITHADIEATIGYCAQLCKAGGTVVWTRWRRKPSGGPDPVPQVCAWFEERGFERVWLSDSRYGQCCGAHRFTGTPVPLDPAGTMFSFVGFDCLS
jgi:hypothetical protein